MDGLQAAADLGEMRVDLWSNPQNCRSTMSWHVYRESLVQQPHFSVQSSANWLAFDSPLVLNCCTGGTLPFLVLGRNQLSIILTVSFSIAHL
jgi:hypothetical protein